ncbi:MAG: hypothetical protein PSW75_09070 [bacterium]|nr:hypothetical protein [bacterium]MDI1337511.1 hypothetical protein [Lacunisphaera sp.]
MSLINDALKRAQKQRTGDAPPLASMPSIGGESAVRIAKRAKPAGFNTLLLRLGLGTGALMILVVGGYFAFRAKPETAKRKAEISQNAAPLPADAKQPAGQTPGSPQGTTVPAFSLPVVAKPEPVAAKPEPAAAETIVAAKPQPAPPVVSPRVSGLKPQASEPAQPASPAPVGKLDNKAITYIENLRVAGIRASATDSKVLMNDRVYRLGDTVERELGLKIVGITSSSLTFENEAGARYTRTF